MNKDYHCVIAARRILCIVRYKINVIMMMTIMITTMMMMMMMMMRRYAVDARRRPSVTLEYCVEMHSSLSNNQYCRMVPQRYP